MTSPTKSICTNLIACVTNDLDVFSIDIASVHPDITVESYSLSHILYASLLLLKDFYKASLRKLDSMTSHKSSWSGLGQTDSTTQVINRSGCKVSET